MVATFIANAIFTLISILAPVFYYNLMVKLSVKSLVTSKNLNDVNVHNGFNYLFQRNSKLKSFKYYYILIFFVTIGVGSYATDVIVTHDIVMFVFKFILGTVASAIFLGKIFGELYNLNSFDDAILLSNTLTANEKGIDHIIESVDNEKIIRNIQSYLDYSVLDTIEDDKVKAILNHPYNSSLGYTETIKQKSKNKKWVKFYIMFCQELNKQHNDLFLDVIYTNKNSIENYTEIKNILYKEL